MEVCSGCWNLTPLRGRACRWRGVGTELIYAECGRRLACIMANGPRNDVLADRRLDLHGV